MRTLTLRPLTLRSLTLRSLTLRPLTLRSLTLRYGSTCRHWPIDLRGQIPFGRCMCVEDRYSFRYRINLSPQVRVTTKNCLYEASLFLGEVSLFLGLSSSYGSCCTSCTNMSSSTSKREPGSGYQRAARHPGAGSFGVSEVRGTRRPLPLSHGDLSIR